MFLNFKTETVDGLKEKICGKFGVIPKKQDLKYLNTELSMGKLAFYGINPKVAIEVKQRSRYSPNKKTIYVKYLTGQTESYKFESFKTIQQLKYEIQEREGK